jgi:DNA invertase Pin-like site-specific DNA recombinase
MQDMKAKRIAVYLRVSTNKNKCRVCKKQFMEKTAAESNCPKCGSSDIERSQTPETQMLPLRRYVQSRNASEVHEYVDRKSSKKHRPELERFWGDARQRLFDAVVILRYDRFARSTIELISAVEEFKTLGIEFISLHESVDTSTAMGKLFFTILAGFAEFERSLIQERVMDGINRAREQGKRLGRPRVVVDREKIRHCARQGQSVKSIAKQFGIGRATVDRILGKLQNGVLKKGSAGAPVSR